MVLDRETGVTIHRTVKELDAGPIAAQAAFVIEDEDDTLGAQELGGAEASSLLDPLDFVGEIQRLTESVRTDPPPEHR